MTNSWAKSCKREHMQQLSAYRNELCRHPKLKYLFFELTDACNLSCLHCGSNACPQNSMRLSFPQIKGVLDQVATRYRPEEIMICLSGGEPLLHPDFFKIAAYAKQCGFLCGVTTNGILIDQRTADRFLESGIDSVGFSLDGLQESHDWFRNKKGAYEAALRGIRNLVERAKGRIATQVTTVVHKKNIHQLDKILQVVRQLGVHSWRPINLEPIGRALDQNSLFLDGEQLCALLEYIREKRLAKDTGIDVTYGCSHYLTPEYELEVRDHYFLCGAGIYVASILCNGDIYGCLDIQRRPELIQGNISRDDFTEVWEHGFGVFRRDRTEESAICSGCDHRAFCKGDSAHTWDYDRKQPLLCMKNMREETL